MCDKNLDLGNRRLLRDQDFSDKKKEIFFKKFPLDLVEKCQVSSGFEKNAAYLGEDSCDSKDQLNPKFP